MNDIRVQSGNFRNTAIRALALLAVCALAMLSLAHSASAQNPQVKDDMEQLAMDLHVGLDRSTLTSAQKDQMRKDLQTLREAHRDHEMIKGLRAGRALKAMLDSGAFRPEDQQRIKQDIQQIREAREDKQGGGM
jgi:Spy/CpxP family protein refolding chaperone